MQNKSFTLFLLFSISVSLLGQQTKEISHYLFPEFISGTVLMKDGRKNPALLNYNIATEEMVFNQNGQVLALADPSLSLVDTVFITDRLFVLYKKQFVELLHQDGYTLCIQHKCTVIPPGKQTAFGGTSQTSSSDSYSSWTSGGQVYDLDLPKDFELKPFSIYIIDNGNGWKEIKSMKQLKNLYKKNKTQLEEYVSQHNPDYEDQEAMVLLIHYMETNK